MIPKTTQRPSRACSSPPPHNLLTYPRVRAANHKPQAKKYAILKETLATVRISDLALRMSIGFLEGAARVTHRSLAAKGATLIIRSCSNNRDTTVGDLIEKVAWLHQEVIVVIALPIPIASLKVLAAALISPVIIVNTKL